MTDGVCGVHSKWRGNNITHINTVIVSDLGIILPLPHHIICLKELKHLRKAEILTVFLRTHSLSLCLRLLTILAFHYFNVECK